MIDTAPTPAPVRDKQVADPASEVRLLVQDGDEAADMLFPDGTGVGRAVIIGVSEPLPIQGLAFEVTLPVIMPAEMDTTPAALDQQVVETAPEVVVSPRMEVETAAEDVEDELPEAEQEKAEEEMAEFGPVGEEAPGTMTPEPTETPPIAVIQPPPIPTKETVRAFVSEAGSLALLEAMRKGGWSVADRWEGVTGVFAATDPTVVQGLMIEAGWMCPRYTYLGSDLEYTCGLTVSLSFRGKDSCGLGTAWVRSF